MSNTKGSMAERGSHEATVERMALQFRGQYGKLARPIALAYARTALLAQEPEEGHKDAGLPEDGYDFFCEVANLLIRQNFWVQGQGDQSE